MNERLKENIINDELNNDSKYKLTFENKDWQFSDGAKDENDIAEDVDNIKDTTTIVLSQTDDEIEKIKCTALVTIKEHRLMTMQAMFKKSIRISLKTFLISLSLSFLNLFT